MWMGRLIEGHSRAHTAFVCVVNGIFTPTYNDSDFLMSFRALTVPSPYSALDFLDS